MNVTTENETRLRLGADRVLAPAEALPQPAECLDAGPPCRPREFELAVERLCLDSTSHREIRAAAEGDPERMATRIIEIVAARGKMHNPETDSGGIALGRVSALGCQLEAGPELGERIATLASLSLTPLRLDAVAAVDPDSPQVEVSGHAYVCPSAPWGRMPEDLSERAALELFDVYGAGSHTRALAAGAGAVAVLGAGHAGKLALAAAREAAPDATLVCADIDGAATRRLAEIGLCDLAVEADLRDPLAALAAYEGAGATPADLTVVVVNAGDCEPAAVLLTSERGTVLFFSMSTNFQRAALTADGMGSAARLLIGNGFAPDRGGYALELARRSAALRASMAIEAGIG